MKFRIKVRNTVRGTEWWEEYDENTTNPQEWAESTIAFFNRTLRSGESPRELLAVEIIDDDTKPRHTWVKVNNVTTRDEDGRLVDLYRCEDCGITGRSYSLDRRIVRDRKYRAKVYNRCDTAKQYLEKKAARRKKSE